MFFPLPVPEELQISFLQLSFIIRFDCGKKNCCQMLICKFFIYINLTAASTHQEILMCLGFYILSHGDWKWICFDCANAITASINTCQMFSVPETSVQPHILWFPIIHYSHPKQPRIILQKCLDGEECSPVLTVQADQLPGWESWTFVPPLLPLWLHEMTWATLNRKPSTSKGYGCLSKAIHQAQKPDWRVRAWPKKKKKQG